MKPKNYKNYFEYAYNLKEWYELKMKQSTWQEKLKIIGENYSFIS